MTTDPREESLRLLRSIDATMRAMLLVLSEKRNDASSVPDSVCNGPYGDPIVRAKDPRGWTAEPMKGRKFSECPPEYLDMIADRFDYFASKDEEKLKDVSDDDEEAEIQKKIRYSKLDAQRARGWAARLRSGYKSQPPAPAQGFSDEPGF